MANTLGISNRLVELQKWSAHTLNGFTGGYSVSGGLPSSWSSLTTSSFAAEAFVDNGSNGIEYVNQAAATVGPLNGGNGLYWIAIHADVSSVPSGWTRQTGTHYIWQKSATRPTTASASVILFSATVTAGAISAYTDYRLLPITGYSTAAGSLPSAGRPGRVAYVTDGIPGLRVDNGTDIIRARDYVNILEFGGKGDDSTDNTPALNAAIAALNTGIGVVNTTGERIYFPPGRYRFNSKPDQLYGGISLIGSGVTRSVLVRNYTEADVRNGLIDMRVDSGFTNPCNIHNLQVYAQTGTTGGSAINIESSSSIAQGDITIHDVIVSGAGTFNYAIRYDGQLKTSAPAGVRGCMIYNALLFQYTTAGVLALSFNNFAMKDVGLFETAGAPSVASLVLDGASGNPSTYATVGLIFCPTARIGVVWPTSQIYYSCPNTTTLTTSTNCTNLTITGNVGTIVGEATATTGTGMATSGTILAGKMVKTSGGASLETADSITFPASPIASSNATTLDGYIEGTFTPVIQGTTTAGAGTYSIQEGYYTKCGNMVMIMIRLVWSAHTGTGNMIVTGFPWSAKGGNFTAPLSSKYSGLTVGAGKAFSPALTGLQVSFFADDPSGGADAAVAMDTAGNLSLNGVYLTP